MLYYSVMEIKRNVLLNPGPATTTDTVKLAQLVPDICPRETEFAKILDQIREDLVKIVHGNPKDFTSVLFCGSGTVAMDVCLNSLLPDKKKVLVINNGSYSTRATEICQHYGLPYAEAKFDFNKLPDLKKIEEVLKKDSDIHMVYTTHNETGTGLMNPIREIGALVHKYNRVFVVDTISTYAMLPIDMEKDNIDFCMSSAQKGLMAMTGLSFVIGRTKLIEQSKDYPKRSYYCNLYRQYSYFKEKGEMHFTPPVQTVYACSQAIKEYFAEGEIKKYDRHVRVHRAIGEGLSNLGFREVIEKKLQSGMVCSALYPNDKNWDFAKIHDYCYKRGFTIYPGKLFNMDSFRLCSLGAIDEADIKAFFEVFKKALKESKVTVPVKY